MMSFKLAIQNVRKNFRDYMIYFMTLAMAVALFYSFNSIMAITDLVTKDSLEYEFMKAMEMIMPILSVFMAFVLGLMIIYSNNFLLKRRSKEVGIYLTLGMDRRKAAKLFAIESIMIGILSLIIGLIVGVFISQFLGLLIKRLLETENTNLSFLFSMKSVIITASIFLVIFLIVSFLNIIHISRLKLINLLQKEKLNEEIKKPSVLTYILAVCSVIILGYSYHLIIASKFAPTDPRFWFSIIGGFIGTMMFTATMSTLVMAIIRRMKKVYFKGISPFTIRQIDSRMRTTSIYLAMMSILLLVSFGSLIVGYAITDTVNKSYEFVTPMDIYVNAPLKGYDELKGVMETHLKDRMKSHFFIAEQNAEIIRTDIPDYLATKKGRNSFSIDTVLDWENFSYMSQVFPNDLTEPKDNEVILVMMDRDFYDRIKEVFVPGKYSMTIRYGYESVNSDPEESVGEESPQNKEGFNVEVGITGKSGVEISQNKAGNKEGNSDGNKEPLKEGTFLVKDIIYMPALNGPLAGTTRIVQKAPVEADSYVLAGFLKDASKEGRKDAEKIFFQGMKQGADGPAYVPSNKETVRGIFKSLSMLLLFTTVFIGLIFLISALSIIALRELSSLTDSTKNFISLRKLGADEAMISRSILTQQSVFFLVPLLLGIVHTLFGVYAAVPFIQQFGQFDFLKFIPVPLLVLVTIYLIYMAITYSNTRRIIKERMKVVDRVQ